MDEPSLVLAPVLVDGIFELLEQLNAEGTTVLLVEQNALASLTIAHRAHVPATGEIVMTGSTRKLAGRPEFTSAYLGT